jgi:homoserine kinase
VIARAFAPASVANVAVGFDILGHAIAGVGDTVSVRRIDEPLVRIEAIRGSAVELPLDAAGNTAGAALMSLREGLGLDFGFAVEIDKGIPFGSGMGGSAASSVAALVAANALLDAPLPREALYPFALDGEAVASGGRHGDNVGPLLLGGLRCARPIACCRSRCRPAGTACWCIRTRCWKRAARARRCRAAMRWASSWRRARTSRWCSVVAIAAMPRWSARDCATCWWSRAGPA